MVQTSNWGFSTLVPLTGAATVQSQFRKWIKYLYKQILRKLGLSRLRSERTIVDFSLKCKLELENWYLVKRKIYWDRSKSFSALENLFWALILDLHHKQPKSHFLQGSLDMVTFYTWNRDSQLDTDLKLVDTSCHWVDTELCTCTQHVYAIQNQFQVDFKPRDSITI